MAARELILLVAAFMWGMAAGCGTPPEAEPAQEPALRIRFVDHGHSEWSPAAEAPSPPERLILSLSGPDGAVIIEAAYADRKAALGELREGEWSLRGDGLDANGNLTWVAPPVAFVVRAGAKTAVDLVFAPAAAD